MKLGRNSCQRGYTLFEIALAIAIVAIVIAGILWYVQSNLQRISVNKTVLQTSSAVNSLHKYFSRDGSFDGASIETLTNESTEIWSLEYIGNGGTAAAVVTHPLNGRVLVASLNQLTEGVSVGQGLVYTLTGVPIESCGDLAVAVEGLALAMSIRNEQAVTVAPANLAGGTLVKRPRRGIDSAQIHTACIAAPAGNSGNQATVSFLLRKS
jgi:prepilin-type N-terminal cleavage/methylation domain-containing protein